LSSSILKIRISNGPQTAMGPGKAELLEAIQQAGSISAAAKQMGMSYRRAWELVNTMNNCFDQPLVQTSPGGANGGGAQVTEFGVHVLRQYRQLIAKAEAAAASELAELSSHLI
jgi:molybdate transport system regulatory protein